MSSSRVPLEPPQALPQVPGPKLAPFTPTAYADIDFIEELGNPEEHLDGHIWKVKINGAAQCYALKMVSIQTQTPRFMHFNETKVPKFCLILRVTVPVPLFRRSQGNYRQDAHAASGVAAPLH